MSELSTLSFIQDNNSPTYIHFDNLTDNIFEIDLNTRTIDTINTVIVESDHRSETLYFKVSRLFDNIDLADFQCVIEYIGADNNKYIYVVPFYDCQTFSSEGKMCFAWELSQLATKVSGKVQFAISFYKVEDNTFTYKINTLPQTFSIQSSIGFTTEDVKVEAQYVESDDEEFQSDKTYYKKIKEIAKNDDGSIKTDATGETIYVVSFEKATEKEDGITYYEKIDLTAAALENYSAILISALDAAKQVRDTYDLTWVEL